MEQKNLLSHFLLGKEPMHKPLIILYGPLSDESDDKYQNLISEKVNCGYREYAKRFGHIIYLRPQKTYQDFEHSIHKVKHIVDFCNNRPDYLVWSVKWDKAKDDMLKLIKNKKIYYSCNNRNMYSINVNLNLVDTEQRVRNPKKDLLWFKGKEILFWPFPSPYVSNDRIYDYVLIGRRADKNELYFIQQLNKYIKPKRQILWIGGIDFQDNPAVKQSRHEIICTKVVSKIAVRDYLHQCKVGILYTEHPTEGFPQSFIEMVMCGVPVIYNAQAPINDYYDDPTIRASVLNKSELVFTAEMVLHNHSCNMVKICRDYAIENLTLSKSYQRICDAL